MHILVTGAAGFIGFHLTRRLLERGDTVVGLDNLNSYYDVRLKRDRLMLLEQEKNVSASSPSGPSAGASATAKRAKRPAKTARRG